VQINNNDTLEIKKTRNEGLILCKVFRPPTMPQN